MDWFNGFLLIIALASIGINVYILTYDIQSHTRWYYIASASIGVFFGLYRIYKISTKSF